MHEEMGVTVGIRVAAARARRSWSQSELARRSGLSQSQISKLESGQSPDLTVTTLVKLADALGVSAAALLADDSGVLLKQLAERAEDGGGEGELQQTFADWYRSTGVAPDEFFDDLQDWVGRGANIVVFGPTGSGKTSFVNYAASLVTVDDRIVTVEDTPELQIEHPNVKSVHATDPRGGKSLSMSELIGVSLRMRPDRLVVGEIRSKEAWDLLQAMNLGHTGMITTVHAYAPAEVMAKLLLMAGEHRAGKPDAKTLVRAVNIIVGVRRDRDGDRDERVCRVVGVWQLLETVNGAATLHPLWEMSEIGQLRRVSSLVRQDWTGRDKR